MSGVAFTISIMALSKGDVQFNKVPFFFNTGCDGQISS